MLLKPASAPGGEKYQVTKETTTQGYGNFIPKLSFSKRYNHSRSLKDLDLSNTLKGQRIQEEI